MVKTLPSITMDFLSTPSDFIIKDVEMLRFSPAIDDPKLIKFIENTIFFPCDIEVFCNTTTADLLERQRAKLHPSQPISLYSANQLSIQNFPLPIIDRTLQPPLLHLSFLTAENVRETQQLVCFSRATANYYVKEKTCALSFVGDAIKAGYSVNLIEKSDLNRIPGDAVIGETDGMREVESRRKALRGSISQRFRQVAGQIDIKQGQIEQHCEKLREIGKEHCCTLLWPVVAEMLKIDSIQSIQPYLGSILRGKSLSPAAINCGSFSIPIMLENRVLMTQEYYFEVLNSYIDSNIINHLKAIGLNEFYSRSGSCGVKIGFKVQDVENEIIIEKGVGGKIQPPKRTKNAYYQDLHIQPENFKRFKLENIEEQISKQKTVLVIEVTGCSYLNEKQILWFLRQTWLKRQLIEVEIVNLLNVQGILQNYVKNGWKIAENFVYSGKYLMQKGSKEKRIVDGRIV